MIQVVRVRLSYWQLLFFILRCNDSTADASSLHALTKIYLGHGAHRDAQGVADFVRDMASALHVQPKPKTLGYMAFAAAKHENWTEVQRIKQLSDALYGRQYTLEQLWYQKLVLLRAFEAAATPRAAVHVDSSA